MARPITPNKFGVDEDGDYMLLDTGEKVRIDADDIPRIKLVKWKRHLVKNYVYVRAMLFSEEYGREREILLQRYLTEAPSHLWADHRNGDTLDNRRRNLRVCAPADNKRNRTKIPGGTSQYKGVFRTMYKREGWKASVRIRNLKPGQHPVRVSPTFRTELEAALWYDKVAREEQGEFACVNFAKDGERGALSSAG